MWAEQGAGRIGGGLQLAGLVIVVVEQELVVRTVCRTELVGAQGELADAYPLESEPGVEVVGEGGQCWGVG
ncbi:hypothetical protein ACFVAQ_45610 [Streptomyces sp. NPDC057651]|uniref:hypothetical protein n=1 Tax=unclassified Streptomyces TaxID=2593676 RepID=UPI00368B6EC7